jgi:FkbM family methyltransferase
MLIPFNECVNLLSSFGLTVSGILHIGAHECEELEAYMLNGVNPSSVVWVDALQEKVDLMKSRGIENVFCAALDSKEADATFNVTNNGQSSSLLEFGTHLVNHPQVHVTSTRTVRTQTLSNFLKSNSLDVSKCNFWNLDIQGKELEVLKGGEDYLKYVQAIYTEVNTESVYKDCGLLSELDAYLRTQGFSRIRIHMTHAGWGDALYVRG